MAAMSETDRADARASRGATDWAGDWRSLAALWGLPAVAMGAAVLLDPAPRAVVWTLMLVWMGAACLANARRCARTHCRHTGPFFLGVAALVVAHAAGVLPLGSYGWTILGTITVVGNALIWWASERLLGRLTRRS
jgi:hypothetical protein